MIDLESLPREHPARNVPLGTLKVFYRIRGETLRPKECGHWKIGKSTYNQLEEFWWRLVEFLLSPDDAILQTQAK